MQQPPNCVALLLQRNGKYVRHTHARCIMLSVFMFNKFCIIFTCVYIFPVNRMLWKMLNEIHEQQPHLISLKNTQL